MPIDTPHPEYAAMYGRWHAIRHAYEGEYAVKQQRQAYLPKPAGMGEADYQPYLQRAKWYGATQRTTQGLAGAVLRKPPQQNLPDEVLHHIQDITLTGVPLEAFVGVLFQEVVLLGRYGVLVDFTADATKGRPLWSGWRAEDIPFWMVASVGGEQRLQVVCLKDEQYVPKDGDPYHLEPQARYRLHYLNGEGLYQIEVWGKGPQGWVPVAEPVVPVRRGEPLGFVPFQFFGTQHLTPAITKPPIEDLVCLNYANYRHSADYEHGLHLTALPTAVITGWKDETQELAIGSQAVWQIPIPEAKVYFLEFQGMGLGSHERAMENDKREMASLGARLLETQAEVQETLGAVRLRSSGEQGALASWAGLVSQGLTQLLRIHAWWAGLTEDLDDEKITYGLNTDFAPVALTGQDLTALMGVWQGGGMSLDSFLWNLQQGERLPPGRTVEQEKALIEVQAPAMVPMEEDPMQRRNGNGQRQREEEAEAEKA